MEKYQNILVIIDANNSEQKALNRAIELAKKTEAKITAFLPIFDFSYEMTTMLSSQERESMRESVVKSRQEWLKELITLPEDNDLNHTVSITTKVVWHNRPFEAIIEQVLQHGFDLVVKSTHLHDKLKSVIFTPTDWHILRKCPCPVLLVKDHLWPKGGNIVAAVNVGNFDDEYSSLNKKITEEAIHLAKLVDGNAHLVNSYPGTPVNIAIEIPEFNSAEYNETMKDHHTEAMEKHVAEFNFDINNTHVKEGLPEDVIEEMAQELDCELVILGTVGRTGISAALIGNTAEHVIDRLNCDLLALKPDGYISPLER
ncbi:MAG: universal stress protein UspE [Thalassotalea sp.]